MSTRTAGRGAKLSLRRDPVRLLCSAGLWSSAGFLAGYLLVSWVLFSVAFTAVMTAAVFAITLAGIPLLAAAAGVVRGCANVERGRLRQLFAEPVLGSYRTVAAPGIMAQARVRWRDPATWRDVAYLIGLWLPLYALDLIVLSVWLVFLAGITLPAWYRFPSSDFGNTSAHGVQLGYFPNGPHGHGGYGFFIATLPQAFLAAAVCLILFLLFNYVLVATARAHARVARSLLRPPADPLAGAREVLAGPRPLGPLKTKTEI
jgi:hypothetical protein